MRTNFAIKENKNIKNATNRIKKILDAKYEKASSLDLNMGHCHIKFCPFSRKLCTIVLPWGKCEHQKLPMGLCKSLDVFQEKMNELLNSLDYVRTYIDYLLWISIKP